MKGVVGREGAGKGAAGCLDRGYRADAALIPEPMWNQLIRAQVGVLWFQVRVRGVPVHVREARAGANAIEAAFPIIEALHGLEEAWNTRREHYPPYRTVEHPLNLTIGRIQAGDWPSSVPAWCVFDVRVAIYPGQEIAAAKHEIEATIRDAAPANRFLANNPPEIVYHGFEAEGYVLKDGEEAVALLGRPHRQVLRH